jgi:hypothetical protein
MMIPSECHLTLYQTVDCFVDPLPLKVLPIVGHFNKATEVMMHGNEGIAADGQKELDPDPSTHDGIMEHGPSCIHYELVPYHLSCLTTSFLHFSKDISPFLLVKAKSTNDNTYGHTYPFSVNPLVAEPLDYG